MLTRRHMVSTIGGIGVAAVFQGQALAQRLSLPFLKKFLSIPIAIPVFVVGSPSDSDVADTLAPIITNNLKHSGLFLPLAPATFIERVTDFEQVPQFASWKQIGAQILLTGRVAHQADGRLKVETRLWDVVTGQQLVGQQYLAASGYGRRFGHIISDQIYAHMTNEKGYFDSRIVFVDESGPSERRVKRLALMDQDGANLRYLTNGTEAVAQPGFVPQSSKICYTQFGGGDPKVCLFDIETGQQERIDGLPAPPLCTPRFSPDGQRLVMSLVQSDKANLFTMDLKSRLVTRLTETPAIDNLPSYSPDGSQICFESDRSGESQIYVMPASGGQAQRISSGAGSYSAPAWSPRGDTIAFSRRDGGQSAIGMVKPDGAGERALTARFYNEGPTFNRTPAFAPNGQLLMFVRDPIGNPGPSLYTIDISGRNELKQPTPGFASDPAWSPLLSE